MRRSIFERAVEHAHRTAIASESRDYTYGDLLAASQRVAQRLLAGKEDLGQARVAFLIGPGFDWVASQWGIWRAGGVAVPLCMVHPPEELAYVVRDSGASQLIVAPKLKKRLRSVAAEEGLKLWDSAQIASQMKPSAAPAMTPEPELTPARRAMIIYTSGTTGKPKGVVSTHANVQAQIETLVEAWGWSCEDRTLLVLPLHHVHGVINVVSCALWAGATLEIPESVAPERVWEAIGSGRITVFMAVPTIYYRLIAAWDQAEESLRTRWAQAASRLRLMVSGSAALPVPVLERWRELTGQTLLERYGMTEIGMALSNSLVGERVPGHVGFPLPGVQVRLVSEQGAEVAPGQSGEIEISGESVFNEYWKRPKETLESFRDSWFRTGDIAVRETGGYRILGRASVDIIKTGGYKVSALEIEEVLRTHPAISDCAVVAIPDPEWGERVAAVVMLSADRSIDLEGLRSWGKQRLAAYKVPSLLKVVEELPRNPLGKVTKPALVELFESPRA